MLIVYQLFYGYISILRSCGSRANGVNLLTILTNNNNNNFQLCEP